jgi:formamidopyrimidine-DNA glycosylase
MTGKYFIEEKLLTPEQKKLFAEHNPAAKVVTFHLGNGPRPIKLTYCDARRFGSFRLQPVENYQQLTPYRNIGLDLLNEPVSSEYLFNCYQKRQVAIKTALLEQDIISGIGNIYASEILFRTKIHPLKKTNQLTYSEVENILTGAKIILKEALQAQGTSAFDFINPLAQPGSYQHKLKVYDRNKKPCLECGTLIKKIETNQRSSFFCPQCQKEA